MENLSVVILAAGEGKRMKSQTSKLAFEACQKPIVTWVYEAAQKAGAESIIAVVGHKKEQVMALLGDKVLYAEQTEQLGTGHALMQAVPFIQGKSRYTIVLNGDAPLVTEKMLRELLNQHIAQRNAATIITADLKDPAGYGRVVTAGGAVQKIVEHKDAAPDELLITEVNSGMYCFDTEKLCQALGKLTNHNAQHEYYLTDTIEILIGMNCRVNTYCVEDEREIWGVNDRVQLYEAEKVLRRRISEGFAFEGVTIVDMDNTYISDSAKIGRDTTILPGTIISGNTVIGENCTVGPNARLTDMELADGVVFEYSVGIESKVGGGTKVGPFAYIRPHCSVGKACKIGDFVELKNSNLGDGTKVSHLTYIGDSDVGSGVNFGCGTVTVNYDGSKKYRTVIEDNTFIGCNTNLISPVTVKEGAYIAAGSTITDDVPENSLAIARSRQVIKEQWNDKRNK